MKVQLNVMKKLHKSTAPQNDFEYYLTGGYSVQPVPYTNFDKRKEDINSINDGGSNKNLYYLIVEMPYLVKTKH